MMRTHQRLPLTHADPTNVEDSDLSPEQVLSGIGILIGFALATGLVYALIEAFL